MPASLGFGRAIIHYQARKAIENQAGKTRQLLPKHQPAYKTEAVFTSSRPHPASPRLRRAAPIPCRCRRLDSEQKITGVEIVDPDSLKDDPVSVQAVDHRVSAVLIQVI